LDTRKREIVFTCPRNISIQNVIYFFEKNLGLLENIATTSAVNHFDFGVVCWCDME